MKSHHILFVVALGLGVACLQGTATAEDGLMDHAGHAVTGTVETVGHVAHDAAEGTVGATKSVLDGSGKVIASSVDVVDDASMGTLSKVGAATTGVAEVVVEKTKAIVDGTLEATGLKQ